ncbi:cupin domain-containing protein [Geminicoccaceae bacterium 1502E]|nr:cupin domain-containing protein [Geminicoccaceae bacterium 1502E]
MARMSGGVTASSEAYEGVSWNILGQRYTLKQASEHSMAWECLLPPEAFVPPHLHRDQDEFFWILEGQLEVELDGATQTAAPGDLVRLPMKVPHAFLNRSGAPVRMLAWVAPAGRTREFFEKASGVGDPDQVVRLAAEHGIEFVPHPKA